MAPLFSEPRVAVVPRSHRLAGKEAIGIAELADEHLLQHPDVVPEWRDIASMSNADVWLTAEGTRNGVAALAAVLVDLDVDTVEAQRLAGLPSHSDLGLVDQDPGAERRADQPGALRPGRATRRSNPGRHSRLDSDYVLRREASYAGPRQPRGVTNPLRSGREAGARAYDVTAAPTSRHGD